MGVTFRSGGYTKHVRFGGRTIKDGEAAAIWNAQGIHTQIIGPKRVWLMNSTIRFLTRHKAESHQYIVVSHVDGRVEHIVGPAVLYHNPAHHDEVKVVNGYRLSSKSECIVAFTNQVPIPNDSREQEQDTTSEMKTSPTTSSSSSSSSINLIQELNPKSSSNTVVKKRIIYGPTLFIPQPNEYVHRFTWSNYDSSSFNSDNNNTSIDINFHILQTQGMTTSFPITVPTNDGYSFDIKLNLSFSISSLDKLLLLCTTNKNANTTTGISNDPIKALYDSLLYDSQTVIGQSISSKDLKNHKGDVVHKLSSSSTNKDGTDASYFPSLYKTSNIYGISIDSFKITSTKLCSELQSIIQNEQLLSHSFHEQLLETKSNTQLNEIKHENERKKMQEKMELKREEMILNNELEKESYEMKVEALERKLMFDKKEMEGRMDIEKLKEDALLDVLRRLKNDMGVDMTKLLTTTTTTTAHNHGSGHYDGMDVVKKMMIKNSNLLGKMRN
jgi:hypothetical protein